MGPFKAVLGIGHRQTDNRQTEDRQTEIIDIEPLWVEPAWLIRQVVNELAFIKLRYTRLILASKEGFEGIFGVNGTHTTHKMSQN